MKKINNSTGFTLVETLLYISIFSLLIGAVAAFSIMIVSSRVKSNSINEVNQVGTSIMQQVTQSLRNSNTINTPASGNTGSSLSINTEAPESTPTLFTLNSGVVEVAEGQASVVPLNDPNRVIVTSLIFRNATVGTTPGSIQIELTLEYVNNSSRVEYEYSRTFYGAGTLRR